MSGLTKDQQAVLDDCVSRIKAGQQVYEYDGKAGTGKTFLMRQIVKALEVPEEAVLPMAYTGAAASVLRKKGFASATTLHSGLYRPELVPNPKYDPHDRDPQTGLPRQPKSIIKFVPKESLDGVQLIVIDEGYMCPRYMKPIIEKFGIPVIVTGDKHQLPPVMAEPAYLYRPDILSLNQIMRQETDNPIVYVANMILNDQPIKPGFYGNKIWVMREAYFKDEYIVKSAMTISPNNRIRDAINAKARRLLGYRTRLPSYGERIICRKNNHSIEVDGIELCNGLIGRCVSDPNLTFENKKYFRMDFLPDISYNAFRNVKCDYDYFIGDNDARRKILKQPFSNGEKFEFAYCITVHLSQGSEAWNGVYFRDKVYGGRDEQRAMDYTAVTRFKNSLIIVVPDYDYYY